MRIHLPKEVKFILTTLTNAGYEAYIVGGCVRDSLMNTIPKDWDIATSAKPHEIKLAFSHTVDTGIAHGTVTVVINRCNYEVTTFRIDGIYLDGRRPEDVTFTTIIEEDLSRRDFTMNAIAYNPVTGIVDPFDGLTDISKKVIRCVGNASLRFTEDALRMMRAIRFSAQLSFDIDTDTYNAIEPLSERLGLISMERIREEFTKILASPNPSALTLLIKTSLWPQILRGIAFYGDLSQAVCWLEQCPKKTAMLYALLYSDEKFMRHLKFDNHTIKETVLYTQWLDQHISNDRYAVKKILNIMGDKQLKNLLTLKGIIQPASKSHWDMVFTTCQDILASGECFTLKDLDINGQVLIDAGIRPGKTMGQIMMQLLERVMANPSLNEAEALLEIALKL